ncbi:MAG TPA: pilus assembly protein PilM [Solirubrobacteraceae bacterium]|nr:pilus assembly protein PilM [Solirubrobacteraceae bacterium]
MPSLPKLNPNLNISLGRRGGALVGLDIQPGYAAAVQAHVNGGITVQQAVGAPLPPDAIREGEVLDEHLLGEALRELFHSAPLGKRVRVGLANQRTVLRTLELPPITDRKQLAAAVRSQAEDQVPMPLANAVLDFHALGIIDTPDGPRQRVVVVAAQREMVERLLRAVRHAGLRPEGVDLSAFALIRSLYRPLGADGETDASARVLYLNVGGLTNMAIAEGTVCRFTRVVGGGLEAMAAEIAERRAIPLVEAREIVADFDLRPAAVAAPVMPAPIAVKPVSAAVTEIVPTAPVGPETSPPVAEKEIEAEAPAEIAQPDAEPVEIVHATIEDAESDVDFHAGFGAPPEPAVVETWALAQDPHAAAEQPIEVVPESAPSAPAPSEPAPSEPAPSQPAGIQAAPTPLSSEERELRMVLENGIREIAGEVRNSLDFHRSQDGGGEVLSVVLSGPALEIAGFAEALEADLGMTVRRQAVGAAVTDAFARVSEHRLAIATGLATEEAVR